MSRIGADVPLPPGHPEGVIEAGYERVGVTPTFFFVKEGWWTTAMGDADGAVRALAMPVAQEAGVDLVDVAVKGSGGQRRVRVVIDRKGGVDLATCQQVSQRLSARLDEDDPIPGRYDLEVTSPGVDHPLEGQRAFDRVEGRDVLVHRRDPDGRVLQVHGRVLRAEPDAVVLDAGDGQVRVAYDEIVKATQRLPW